MSEQFHALAHNIQFLAHSNQGGHGDGVQVMVHRGHAYIGHLFSGGVTVLDVGNPRAPLPVNFIPAPPGTWSLHLQAHDDLLLVVNARDQFAPSAFTTEAAYYSRPLSETSGDTGRGFAAGMRVFDISSPARPREIGFMPVEGLGVHRIWYVGGQYAYMSALPDGFTDFIFLAVDMRNPARPEPVGRWWVPGMWRAGGETPTWENGRRYALHHPIVAGDLAYCAWGDGGLVLLDVADPHSPRLLAHRNWCPPFGGGTHTALPLPDRGLAIVADEAVADNCADQLKYTWVVDVRQPANPVTIATFPTPAEEDYCAKGGHFGPHNLHENRPGSFQSSELVFATYQNAGVRAFDVSNPFRPEQVAYFVPPPPERLFDIRPGRPRVVQSSDVFVDRNGVIYLTDYNAGLYVLEYKG